MELQTKDFDKYQYRAIQMFIPDTFKSGNLRIKLKVLWGIDIWVGFVPLIKTEIAVFVLTLLF